MVPPATDEPLKYRTSDPSSASSVPPVSWVMAALRSMRPPSVALITPRFCLGLPLSAMGWPLWSPATVPRLTSCADSVPYPWIVWSASLVRVMPAAEARMPGFRNTEPVPVSATSAAARRVAHPLPPV